MIITEPGTRAEVSHCVTLCHTKAGSGELRAQSGETWQSSDTEARTVSCGHRVTVWTLGGVMIAVVTKYDAIRPFPSKL